MRILERCTAAWPMPEMRTQIDALREAFSADISRPFELKPNFPYGSPSPDLQSRPPFDLSYHHDALSRQASHEQIAQEQYRPRPLTPPMSGQHELDQDRPLADASLPMIPNGEQQPMPLCSDSIETDPAGWNPSRIIEYGSEDAKVKSSTNESNSQWNAAFGIDARTVTVPQPSPPLYTPSSIGSHDLSPLHDTIQQQQGQHYPVRSSITPISQPQTVPATSQPSYTSAGPSFVTSSMWRDTVANTYDPGGHKRRWDMEAIFLVDPPQSKGSR